MTPSPTDADAHRCRMPMPPLTSGTATMPRPSQVTSPRSSFGIAVSMKLRMNSGGSAESAEITTIVTSRTTSSGRYGRA